MSSNNLKLEAISLDLKRLCQDPNAPMLLALMRFINDAKILTITEDYFKKKEQDPSWRFFADGARTYTFRITCAHIREALKMLPSIQSNTTLMAIVDGNEQTKQAFNRLIEHGPLGAKKTEFELFKSVRNKVAFHYLDDELSEWLQEGISHLSEQPPALSSYAEISSPSKTAPTWFPIAEEVYHWITDKKIWGVPYDGDEPSADHSKMILEVLGDLCMVAQTIINALVRQYRITQ